MREEINQFGMCLKIFEYGKLVRQYSDSNYERFVSESKRIIDNHLSYIRQNNKDEVKNITINICTYD